MTTSNEQVPEATRLADEWLRETQREVDRRNSAYDHYGMGNTPETLDPLGAKMAAELRRQHAENEALRAGYNAARLEIESLKPQIIPGVQWQCGPLASGFTAHAVERFGWDAARHFFDAGWKACANFCDRDDVRFDGIVGHRGCPQFEEAFRVAHKQGGL